MYLAFFAGVLGRVAALSFICLRLLPGLLFFLGWRTLHLYRSPSRVGFAFALLFCSLPCYIFFCALYVVMFWF